MALTQVSTGGIKDGQVHTADLADSQITAGKLHADALDHTYTLGASGTDHYTFTGEGLTGAVNDPTLYLTRGKTYRFVNGNSSGAHPFRIQSVAGAGGTEYNTGVTNNAGGGGSTIIFEVPHDAPDVLYYICTSHANMNGIFYVTGALADGSVTTAKLNDDAVTDAKLANSINTAIAANTAKTTNATHTGDVTGSTSLTIAADAVTTAKIADEAVTLAKLPHGDGSSDGKFLRSNNGADPTFETVNTDLVSDTSPQLGGLLDGNGNTANFTANNTGLGLPIGTDANEPNAANYKGYLRFNDTDDELYFSNGTTWRKIVLVEAVLTSVSGTLFAGIAANLTLAGTGFISSGLVVNFVQSSDSINENVTVTPSSDTAASVAVPAAVYNNVTAGNAVTIKVTNSDGMTSGTVNKTATSLPTGGTITTYTDSGTNYRVHSFTSSGTFTNTISGLSATYLIVAGGGGAGSDSDTGGGGGAGGLLTGTTSPSVAGHSISVGSGGSGGAVSNGGQYAPWKRGTTGGNSSAFGLTAYGGGWGNTRVSGSAGGSGGSGGGGGDNGNQPGGSGTSGQGHSGGGNTAMNSHSGNDQGGGGGAGGAGSGRHPGAGVSSSITGTAVVYSRGGTGHQHPNATNVNGLNNGWGGKGSDLGSASDGNGANGIVIVRYVI